MSAESMAALREAARDFMIVSSFAFWAVMIGFAPVAVVHALMA